MDEIIFEIKFEIFLKSLKNLTIGYVIKKINTNQINIQNAKK